MAEQREKKRQDDLSLAEVIRSMRNWWYYFWANRLILAIALAVGLAIGFIYALRKKAVYHAVYTFVLEDDATGSIGAYSGLASMVGINVGGMSGSNTLFKGDNIFDLYRSRRMISKTLLTPVEFSPGKPELLINRYISSSGLKEEWKDDPVLSNLSFGTSPEKFTMVQDSIITMLVEDINQSALSVDKLDKKLSTITVQIEAKDPLFAIEFVNRLVANVNAFYSQTKTKKTAENVRTLQRKADSVKRVLGLSISRTALAREANPNANIALKSLDVSSQKKQIDVEASSAIYLEIVKNLEISKLTLAKETPLIQEIDRPVLPLKKIKTRKMVAMTEFGLLALFLTAVFLALRKIWVDEIQ